MPIDVVPRPHSTVRQAIMTHRLEEVEDVTNYTKAGGGCTDCHHEIRDLIRECWEQIRADEAAGRATPVAGTLQDLAPPARTEPVAAADGGEADLIERIRALLADDIAPALRNDGGDIEFVRYDSGRVYVRLTGACAACRASDATIKGYVESQLREFVDDSLSVFEVD